MASLKSYALFRDPQGRITAKESRAKSARGLFAWLWRQRASLLGRADGWSVRFVVCAEHPYTAVPWDSIAGGATQPNDVTLYARVEELDDAMAAAKARLGGGA